MNSTSGTSRTELKRTVNRLALICGLGVIAGAALVAMMQPSIRARLWHWRHGTTLSVGNVEIPAPRNYAVEPFGDGYLLVRLDTADRTPTKRIKSSASIGFTNTIQITAEQVEVVTEKLVEFSREHDAHETQRKDFTLPSGSITCLGGDPLPSGGITDVPPVTWNCRSTFGLEFSLNAIPADMDDLWSIVAGIRVR